MKISYVAQIRLPTEKAHGYQIMRVCHELAKRGITVELIVPARANDIQEDPFTYYGIEKNFTIRTVSSFDAMHFVLLLGPLASLLAEWSFVHALKVSQDTVIYTREHRTARHFARRGYRVFYNAHNWKPSRRALLTEARGVVCNSRGTERAVRESTELPTVVAHNAADPNPHAGTDKRALRQALGLPEESAIALYAGHLYGWKGIDTIIAAARLSPEILFVVVGGTARDVASTQSRVRNMPNVSLLGHMPRTEIPKYLAAADVLVLPNTARNEESAQYTSPLKLFEYMASGTPIVASDLPSVREILSGDTAFLVAPDNPAALAEGVVAALADSSRARRALEESTKHTWEAHAVAVADFMARHSRAPDMIS